MALHRTAAVFKRVNGPISLALEQQVKSGRLRLDLNQASLSALLDDLYSHLSASKSHKFLIPEDNLEHAAKYYAGYSSLSLDNLAGIAFAKACTYISSSPRGIYIHGSVGVGKSMLMDLFYRTCTTGYKTDTIHYQPIKRRCMRIHFHEFMLDVHQRIHSFKKEHPRADPIPSVAAVLAKEARLLCFDEMQITDIADAMIMKRLITLLFDLGVTVVTTSNRAPCGLYEGGINRSVFLPFIDTLKEKMTVIEMDGEYDYRKNTVTTLDSSVECLPAYLHPAKSKATQTILEQWFLRGSGITRTETIPVAMGRLIHVQKVNNSCGWFSFDELCNRPLGAADYIAIANRFNSVIVEDVPQLGGDTYNEARRFVVLIDALYEAKTKLIMSSNVPREELFVGFDATVDTYDGDEEIAVDNKNIQRESFVVGEGGSSSSASTTMIRTDKNDGTMEWSATGRIGVSLAQLSAVKEVSFSFKRAESRLAEMASANWRTGTVIDGNGHGICRELNTHINRQF